MAGYTSTAKLADRLGAGLSDKTLRNVESRKRKLKPHEIAEITTACGLPPEFFAVDFDRLPEIAGDPNQVYVQTEGGEMSRMGTGRGDLDRLAEAVAWLTMALEDDWKLAVQDARRQDRPEPPRPDVQAIIRRLTSGFPRPSDFESASADGASDVPDDARLDQENPPDVQDEDEPGSGAAD